MPDQLISRFKQGLDKDRNLTALHASYKKGNRESDFIMLYLETLFVARETDNMNAVMAEYFQNIPLEKLKEEQYWQVFERYDEDIVSPQVFYVFDNREEFYKIFGKSAVDAKINRLYSPKVSYYLYGHKPPIEDPIFLKMLTYLQSSDYPKASEWLAYLVPAQYKYKDWIKMAEEVNNVSAFNIFKGNNMFKDMMITQYTMYCDNPTALNMAVKWCDEIIATLDDGEKVKALKTSKKQLINKSKEDKLEWTSVP